MLYTGWYEHTIDAKNRLSIPSAIRSRMDPEIDGTAFYLAPGESPVGPSLALWPSRIFENHARRVSGTAMRDPRRLVFDQLYYATACLLELDKLGRVRLPEPMLRRIDVGREVIIFGSRDHLEIQRREDFEAFLNQYLPKYAEVRQGAFESDRDAQRMGPNALPEQ